MKYRYCPKCGTKNSLTAHFCDCLEPLTEAGRKAQKAEASQEPVVPIPTETPEKTVTLTETQLKELIAEGRSKPKKTSFLSRREKRKNPKEDIEEEYGGDEEFDGDSYSKEDAKNMYDSTFSGREKETISQLAVGKSAKKVGGRVPDNSDYKRLTPRQLERQMIAEMKTESITIGDDD